LAFENVYVPKENLLGEEENVDRMSDLSVREVTVGQNEIELAANAMGMARAAYEAALDYAKQRVQGGKPIIEHQAVAGVLADIYMELQALRSMVWHTAWDLSYGKKNRALSLSCARFASKVVRKATQDALSIFGGMGTEKELPMERYVRDSLVFMHLGESPVKQVRVGNLLKR
jgi:alkylation response protein AidB-like acyl-CoA dehydrogenase